MRILTSRSRRFSSTLNYSLPEYRIPESRVRRQRALNRNRVSTEAKSREDGN